MKATLPPYASGIHSIERALHADDPTVSVRTRFAESSLPIHPWQRLLAPLTQRRPAPGFRHLLLALGWLLLALGGLSAGQAQTVDLSLSKVISNKTPLINDTVTYTLTLRNTAFNGATGVVVTDLLPTAGADYVSGTVTRGTGSFAFAAGTGTWTVGALAARDSATLQIKAKVKAEGVWFNQAYVSAQNQSDEDSSPGNQVITEDDYANACFSVPITLYADEEITVSVPSGYKNIVWSRNGTPITANSDSSLAKLNPDSSLLIRSIGTYTFTNTIGNCPASGCCPIVVIPAPCGSIGDFVFIDNDNTNTQTAGDVGLNGVRVRLFQLQGNAYVQIDSTLTATFNAQPGYYKFPCLKTGVYQVQFVAPTGQTLVIPNTGGNPALDSDAGAGGFSAPISINTALPAGNAGRDNTTIDAGIVPVLVCIKPVLLAGIGAQRICQGDTTSLVNYTVSNTAGTSADLLYQWYTFTANTSTVGSAIGGATGSTFRPTGAQLPPANGIQYFYAVIVSRQGFPGTCSDTLFVGITVNLKPVAPDITNDGPTVCAGGSVSLVAVSPGNSIRWYTTPTGGQPITTTASGAPFVVMPTMDTTYYAEAVSPAPASCPGPRTPVTVTVNPKPGTPTCFPNGLSNVCPDSTVNILAAVRQQCQPSLLGSTFEVRTGPAFNSPLLADSILRASTVVYLFEKSVDGCYSDAKPINVTISSCQCQLAIVVTITAPTEVCGKAPINATATVSGAAVGGAWSSNGSGMFSSVNTLATVYTPSRLDSLNGVVTLTFTTFDPDGEGRCRPVAKSVVVQLRPVPIPPFNVSCADSVICKGSSTKLFAFSTPGSTIRWYTTPTGGQPFATSLNGGFITVSPMITTTYYAEAILGPCVNPQRTPITVNVKSCDLIDLALVKDVDQRNPALGDTITYTIEVQNGGPAVATGIEIRDPLPAGLQFVSSANLTLTAGTLVGTLPSLASGAFFRFSFKAKVLTLGLITNRAAVTKANEQDKDSTPGNGYTNAEDDESFVDINVRQACDPKPPVVISCKCKACPGQCVTLTAYGCENGTVTWSNGATGSVLRFCPTQEGSYSFSATCTVGTCTSGVSNVETIVVTSPVAPVVTASATTVCGNGSVTLTATGCAGGTITWNTNPVLTGSSITVSPVVTTSYSATCTIGQCTSPASAPVTITVANPPVPIIGCANTQICPGSSTTLTAFGCTGTVVWNTNPVVTGTTITVSPTMTTTYKAQCQIGTCLSGFSNSITVNVLPAATPTITASATTLCTGGSVTLTATGCSGGVLWSNQASGYVITVTQPGSYTAQCVGAGCSGPASAPVVIRPGTTPPPVVTCGRNPICVGECVVLTANGCAGIVTWNTSPVQYGSTITVCPTQTTGYSATCTVNGCVSAASNVETITVNPQPAAPVLTASKNPISGGESVTLTATGCAGTVSWNTTPAQLGASISVSPTATTTYTATCTVNGCSSTASITITVNACVLTPPVVTCGRNPICVGECVVLTANGCAGTVTWNTSPAQFGNTITVCPTQTTGYTATCTVGNCVSAVSNVETITVNPKPAAPVLSASKNPITAGESVILTAAGCAGTVTWNTTPVLTGNSITVTPTNTTSYTAICTVNGCPSPVSIPLVVVVNQCPTIPPPIVTCGSMIICLGESDTLRAFGCTGTVVWNDGLATGSVLVVTPTQTTTYSARCQIGNCLSEVSNLDEIMVIVPTTPTITASKTSIALGESITLTATGCNGTVIWSNGGVGTPLVVTPSATTTYTARCAVGRCTSPASLPITVTVSTPVCEVLPPAPLLSAVPNPITAGDSVTLTATGCTGLVIWSNEKTGMSIVERPLVTTSYTAKCKVGTCISVSCAPITVVVNQNPCPTPTPAPTISANVSTLCEGGIAILTAYGCEGGTVTWNTSPVRTGMSITVSPTVTTSYTATCTKGQCPPSAPSAPVTITVGRPQPPVLACNGLTVCAGQPVTLFAAGCPDGTIIWNTTPPQSGSSITVSPTQTTTYTAKCVVGNCESLPSLPITITVGRPAAPTLSASADNTCPGVHVTLTAANCAGSVTWNVNGMIGASIVVSPFVTTTYSAVCGNGQCLSDTARITVTVKPTVPKPTVVTLVNTCPVLTVNLNDAVTSGGTYEFREFNDLGSNLVANPTAIATAGTYWVFAKANGCTSQGTPIYVTIIACPPPANCTQAPAVANAGPDLNMCASEFILLDGKISGAASFATWSTPDGTGSFDNVLKLDATYKASLADLQKGKITFVLTTNDPDGAGPCQAGRDTTVLTLKGIKFKPTIAVAGSNLLCHNDSVTLSAQPGYRYVWRRHGIAFAATQTITVKDEGIYTVQLKNSNDCCGCCSIDSDPVTISTKAPMPNLLANQVFNTCPSLSIDLRKAVSVPGDSVEFHLGNTPESPLVINPGAVSGGIYYAFLRSGEGCYSNATAITATVQVCADSLRPAGDLLSLSKVADKPNLSVGDTVKYTLTVTNHSLGTVTNVILRDVLPSGLTYLSGGPQALVSGDTVKFWRGVLDPGESYSHYITAKVTGVGTITNLARIASFDGVDSVLNNNVAQAIIHSRSTYAGTRLGIAKVAGQLVKLGPNGYELTYEIRATNYGSTDLTKVRLTDDLGAVFTNKGAIVVLDEVTADAGFTLDTTYTGMGLNTGLLIDSLSTLPAGTTRWVRLKLRVDLSAATDSVFNNVAMGKAWAADASTSEDASETGLDADPDADLDPANNNVPTEVTLGLNALGARATIGLAMQADTARQPDGSYRVTYTLVLKNYGTEGLKKVQVSDSLAKVFDGTSAFALLGQVTARAGSTLTPNPDFDGRDNPTLLLPENSTLAAGQSDTLRFTLNVQPDGRPEPYLNSALATALYGDTTKVSDYSTAGLNPALNGLPGLSNEPTPVLLLNFGDGLFIPEGFSPNADGINDRFVIRNVGGATIDLQIFNRWGQRVYGSADYKNDWNGKANAGTAFGTDGLPDGTYYYVVKLSDGRTYTRFLTLMR